MVAHDYLEELSSLLPAVTLLDKLDYSHLSPSENLGLLCSFPRSGLGMPTLTHCVTGRGRIPTATVGTRNGATPSTTPCGENPLASCHRRGTFTRKTKARP